jgi:hypothetical protein
VAVVKSYAESMEDWKAQVDREVAALKNRVAALEKKPA